MGGHQAGNHVLGQRIRRAEQKGYRRAHHAAAGGAAGTGSGYVCALFNGAQSLQTVGTNIFGRGVRFLHPAKQAHGRVIGGNPALPRIFSKQINVLFRIIGHLTVKQILMGNRLFRRQQLVNTTVMGLHLLQGTVFGRLAVSVANGKGL